MYTILKQEDLSHIGARRLQVVISVPSSISKREIRTFATEITELMKKSNLYRNEIAKLHFQDRTADVVWIFAAFNEKDADEGKWVCRMEWISPYLANPMRPTPMSPLKGQIVEQLDNGIKIAWDVQLKEYATIPKI